MPTNVKNNFWGNLHLRFETEGGVSAAEKEWKNEKLDELLLVSFQINTGSKCAVIMNCVKVQTKMGNLKCILFLALIFALCSCQRTMRRNLQASGTLYQGGVVTVNNPINSFEYSYYAPVSFIVSFDPFNTFSYKATLGVHDLYQTNFINNTIDFTVDAQTSFLRLLGTATFGPTMIWGSILISWIATNVDDTAITYIHETPQVGTFNAYQNHSAKFKKYGRVYNNIMANACRDRLDIYYDTYIANRSSISSNCGINPYFRRLNAAYGAGLASGDFIMRTAMVEYNQTTQQLDITVETTDQITNVSAIDHEIFWNLDNAAYTSTEYDGTQTISNYDISFINVQEIIVTRPFFWGLRRMLQFGGGGGYGGGSGGSGSGSGSGSNSTSSGYIYPGDPTKLYVSTTKFGLLLNQV